MAAARASMARINASKKENLISSSPASSHSIPASLHSTVLSELQVEQKRSKIYQNRSYQLQRRVSRLKTSKEISVLSLKSSFAGKLSAAASEAVTLQNSLSTIEESNEELQAQLSGCQLDLLAADVRLASTQKTVDKLRMRSSRAADSKSRAVSSALAKVSTTQGSIKLKEKGVITNPVRALTRELVHMGVPVSKINNTIHSTAEALGIQVEGSITERSVGRIMVEGGVASEFQMVEEFHNAESMFPHSSSSPESLKFNNYLLFQPMPLHRMAPLIRTRTMREEWSTFRLHLIILMIPVFGMSLVLLAWVQLSITRAKLNSMAGFPISPISAPSTTHFLSLERLPFTLMNFSPSPPVV